MKAFQTIKYLAFAGAATLWSCSSQQYAQKQNTEYDDLYFSSTDKKEVVYTASTSNNNYSSTGNTGVVTQDNSQKNVNPEYIQQYADQGRSENEQAQTNDNDSYSADDSYAYYDENYRKGDGGGVTLPDNIIEVSLALLLTSFLAMDLEVVLGVQHFMILSMIHSSTAVLIMIHFSIARLLEFVPV
jgi:hypothetical protein